MTAAAAALTAGLGQASAGPIAAGTAAAPAPAALEVQYWGGWGPPRVYEYDDEPPVYRRRYVVPEVEDVLPASEAIAIARSMGYRAISRPRLAGRVWVVETVGGAGQRARVTIHAYTGAPINIRELEPGGQRFPTPPVWSDERPSFGNAPAPGQREGRLGPDGLERPERPARPAPNITARVVPVPTPRPDIDGDLTPRPQVAPPVPPVAQPPAAETPAAPPPAASLPRRVDPPATPPSPLSVQPTQPFTPPAAAPPQAEQPTPEPPTAALPPRPEPATPTPPAPQVEPAPPAVAAPEAPAPEAPAAALPQAVPDPMPAAPAAPAVDPSAVPSVPAEPPRSEAAPSAETAQKPNEDEGVLIDGRFLGPNGEQLPPTGSPSATPGVRQVTPPPSN
jgi:hypothetical protein